jgi:glucose/arabinose dehydrogenase
MKKGLFLILMLVTMIVVTLFNGCMTEQAPATPTVTNQTMDNQTNDLLDKITLPEGFSIEVYAEVPGARSMALGPNSTLFVGTRETGKVYAVTDDNKDRKADQIITIAESLDQPNGVDFWNNSLYVAQTQRIIRYDNIEENLQNPGEPIIVYDDIPNEGGHDWKHMRIGPDEKIYFGMGAPCNICNPGDPYASIARISLNGSDFEVYARGVRNTVGFDWAPGANEIWFTDNGRDFLGDNMPPDELNRAPEIGMHFGYPFCHGKNIEDPEFKDDCSKYTQPVQELGPHVASLGMRFYTGDMFPEEYKNQIFIAEHGSWNRNEPIGYRVTLVRLENNMPVSYTNFAQGWLQDGNAWGRPVDIEVMDDGSMLVSDDKNGKIYRITYNI